MQKLRLAAVCTLLLATSAFAGNVTLKFQGTTKDALKAIAAQAGVNLIVVGDMKDPMELYLNDASAEDALATVARSANLHVEKSGSIWTVRAMTDAEKEAAKNAPAETVKEEPEPQVVPNLSNLPPIPPIPQLGKGAVSAEEAKAVTAALTKELQKLADRADLDEDDREELNEAIEELQGAEEQLSSAQDDEDKAEAESEFRAAQRQAERMLSRTSERLARAQERAAQKAAQKALLKGGNHRDEVSTGAIVVPEGKVVQNAVSFGGPVDVQGTVTGNVVAYGGPVHLGPKSVVEGSVTSFGGRVDKEEGAEVHGEVVSFGGPKMGSIAAQVAKANEEIHDANTSRPGGGFFSTIAAFLVRFAVLFGLGFLFSLFAPQRMKALEGEIHAQPGKSFVTGILGSLALIPLTVLLAVTLVGIPFMIAMWLMASLGVAMGYAAFASEVGMRLPMFRGKKTQALVLAVGLFALLVIGFIPVIGPLVEVSVAMIGFGAIIRTRFGSLRRLGAPTPIDQIPA